MNRWSKWYIETDAIIVCNRFSSVGFSFFFFRCITIFYSKRQTLNSNRNFNWFSHTVFGRSSTSAVLRCFVTVVNMLVRSIGQMCWRDAVCRGYPNIHRRSIIIMCDGMACGFQGIFLNLQIWRYWFLTVSCTGWYVALNVLRLWTVINAIVHHVMSRFHPVY